MHSDEMEDIDEAKAGDIVATFGVDCASGDTFTDGKLNYAMTSMHVPDAVISLAIHPKDKTQAGNFSKALQNLEKKIHVPSTSRRRIWRDDHLRYGRTSLGRLY